MIGVAVKESSYSSNSLLTWCSQSESRVYVFSLAAWAGANWIRRIVRILIQSRRSRKRRSAASCQMHFIAPFRLRESGQVQFQRRVGSKISYSRPKSWARAASRRVWHGLCPQESWRQSALCLIESQLRPSRSPNANQELEIDPLALRRQHGRCGLGPWGCSWSPPGRFDTPLEPLPCARRAGA